ncbi:MAG: VWA domain-containing protein, partial [Candidatus Kapaibacterium sp.]
MTKMLRAIIFILLYAAAALPLAAQSLFLTGIDSRDYPDMRADFLTLGTDSAYVPPTIDDLRLYEDGVEQGILSISCENPRSPRRLSTVLTIDISGSMNNGGLNMAKTAAKKWIEMLNTDSSECAITSFAQEGFINQSFTQNKDLLNEAIDALSAEGGTNHNAGLIFDKGAIPLCEQARYHRIVVFLTDGEGTLNLTRAQDMAHQNSVTIYCVNVGMKCPADLRQLSLNTGGQYYEYITSVDQLIESYKEIMALALNTPKCTIEWRSGGCEQKRTLRLEDDLHGISAEAEYHLTLSQFPNITKDPEGSLKMVASQIGVPVDKQVVITAEGDDITISGAIPSVPQFEIIDWGGPPPEFTLAAGESRTITCRYTPADSFLVVGSIELITDACVGSKVYMGGGFPGNIQPRDTLRVVVPNGGEIYPVGVDTLISWDGILPDDEISIELSTDGGNYWEIVSRRESGFEYDWLVPNKPSGECLIKVIHDNMICEFPDHSDFVYSVDFHPFDNIVASGGYHPYGRKPTIYLWDTENCRIIDSLTGGHEYSWINAVEFSPDGKMIASVGDDGRLCVWDVESRQLLWRTPERINIWYIDLAWMLDSREIIALGSSSDLIFYDAATGQRNKTLSSAEFFEISMDPSGQYIVTGRGLINAQTGEETLLPMGGIIALSHAISPAGDKLALGAYDGRLYVYDLMTQEKIFESKCHNSEVRDVAWSPDGSMIASAGSDLRIVIHNAVTYSVINKFKAHTDIIQSLDFNY